MAYNERRDVQATPTIWGFASLPVILLIAAMIVGLAALLPLVQSSGATTTAGSITQLQQQHDDWQARLEEEQAKVAQLSSMNTIRQEATTRLKMVEPAEKHYITVDAPAPAPDPLPSRFLPQQKQPPTAGKSLWDDILDRLPF
jgi:cell division protein FtsL